MSTPEVTKPGDLASPTTLPPHAILWQALKPVVAEADVLEMTFNFAARQITVVDTAPRHDTVLNDDALDFGLFARMVSDEHYTLLGTAHDVAFSIKQLETATGKIKGRFRGADKVNMTDRLHRHLVEARALLSVLNERSKKCVLPRKPFEIRQLYAASLWRRTDAAIGIIIAVRNQCKQYDFADGSDALLYQVETKLARMRSKLGQWRDNPSQKLGHKISDAYAQMRKIRSDLVSLQDAAQLEARRQGVRFFNRQGPC